MDNDDDNKLGEGFSDDNEEEEDKDKEKLREVDLKKDAGKDLRW